MKNDPGWAISATADIGKRVAAFRERRGMTVQALADRCAELGLPLGRVALTKLETGKRLGVTPAELMVFAAVFEVAPIELIFSIGYAGRVELFPGAELRPLDAVNWFCGGVALDVSLDGARVRQPQPGEESSVWLLRYHHDLVNRIEARESDLARARADLAANPGDEHVKKQLADAEATVDEWLDFVREPLRRTRADMRERGMILPPVPAVIKLDDED